MLDKLNSLPCNLYNLFFMYEQFISLINICLKPIGGDIGSSNHNLRLFEQNFH